MGVAKGTVGGPSRGGTLAPLTRDSVLLPVAVAAIITSVALLVTVPILVENRIKTLGVDQIEVLDLTSLDSRDLAFALSQEMNALREYETVGDAIRSAEFQESRDIADRSAARLEVLEERLPPELASRWDSTEVAMSTWHRAIDAQSETSFPSSGTADYAMSQFNGALDELAVLQENISTARDDRDAQITRAERYGLVSTIALALLALMSVGLVVWLGQRARRYAAEAQRQNQRALQATEARTRLMRGFSHDLKNPLGVIRTSAEMLQMGMHGPLSADQEQAVERMHRTADRGLTLLEDLVELSQAETGQLPLERSNFAPATLLNDIVDQFLPRAQSAGLSIKMRDGTELPQVFADERRVRQILENLIGNAINYTPSGGGVTVHAEALGQEKDAGRPRWLAISVKDTGPGIATDEAEHIFEEFVRLPDAAKPGSGIGLAISRQLARLMGGDITLESEVGRGSKFTLQLPVWE